MLICPFDMNKNYNLTCIKIIVAFVMFFCLKNISFAAEAGIIHDNCYVIKTSGVKTGYLLDIQKEKTENGKKYIITEKHLYQKIKRANDFIEIRQDTVYTEDKSGNPVSFQAKLNSSGENTVISGKFISDGELSVDIDINGVKSSKNIKPDDKILFPYAIDNLYKNTNSKTVVYNTIEPSIDIKSIRITTENIGQEKLGADGLNHTYYKYRVSTSILPEIISYEWRDRSGKDVKESIPALRIDQVLSTKKESLSIADEINREDNYDLFSNSLIYTDKTITNPEFLEQAVYKIITSVDVDINDLFINDSRQKLNKLSRNSVYLTVNSEKPETKIFPYPISANETKKYAEYLESGPFITTDNNKISAAASSLASGETDSYTLAKKMENWVFNNITNKNFSLDFANAANVIETKTGDCTEHAVLLASLLRAAGIPSKVVVGLAYINMDKPAFSYHMWTKAYIGNGKWINLDSALPRKNFVPTHLAMDESPLNNLSDRSNLFIDILKSFSYIKISVINADKPLIISPDSGIIKISLNNSTNNGFLYINIKNAQNPNINNISLNDADEQDYSKSAFYDFTKGNVKKALDEFNVSYNLIPPADDFSYIKLGVKLSQLGFFNLAQKSFNNINDKDIWGLIIDNTKSLYFPKKKYAPADEMVICDAISKILRRNMPEEGIRLINQSKKDLLNDDFAHYLLAKAYISQNNYDSARKELDSALKLYPENLSYQMEMAKVYTQQNSYKSAERELNTVSSNAAKAGIQDGEFMQNFNEQYLWMKFKSERGNPFKSKYYKAKYYETKGEYNISLEILNNLTKIIPDKINLSGEDGKMIMGSLETKGNIYIKLNRYDNAENVFKQMLQLDEKSAEALTGLGDIYFLRNNYQAAIDRYKKALEINPNNYYPNLKLAEAYMSSGQEDRAYYYYTEVLKNSPMNQEANYNIGIMCLKRGDTEQAELLMKKALSVNPMNSSIWSDIAGIEISKGNYETAKSYLIPVSFIEPKNSYYYYYTGLIFKAQGDIGSARYNFEKAKELKPDFDQAEQALESL